MTKHLRAGSPSAAYVAKDFADQTNVYLTMDFSFDPSDPFSTDFALFRNTDVGGGDDLFGLLWTPSPGNYWVDQWDSGQQSSSPLPLENAYQTLELHYQKGVLTEGWIDGTQIITAGSEFFNEAVNQIRVGQAFGTSTTVAIDNVKIGTTRGGSELFTDDFESGNLSAWDHAVGAVSVVDDTVVADSDSLAEVSVAFTSTTLETFPVWTQLDDPNGYRPVSAWRIDRGRSSEFDKTVTGTASIDFNDQVGLLDPTNASGPFFGQIDPMRQVRIRLRNPISGVWSYLFKGFASEWQYDMDVSEKFSKVALECADAFDLLAALEMTPGHHGDTAPAESEGDIAFDQGPPGIIGGGHGPSRIHKALNDAGWPAGPREIFPGNVVLQQSIYTRLDQLLSVLFDAADAEFPGVANVYISKSGYVTFHGRYPRFDPTNPLYGIQTWNVGDHSAAGGDATIAPISGLSYRRSKADLINVSVCTPQIPAPGGEFTTAELSTMTIKDDTSIASYGWRAAHYENLLTLTGRSDPTTTTFDVEAKDEVKLYSQWLVENYKAPKTRVEQIVFRSRDPDSFSGPAIWNLLCGVEIGDIVNLTTSHPGGGGFEGEDFFVEGIHYDAQPFHEETPDITLTLDVSPKSLYDFNPFA